MLYRTAYRNRNKAVISKLSCSLELFVIGHIKWGSGYPLRKKLAFLQLLRSSEAAEKLRKSRRYWHLRKSRLLRRAAEKPAFMKLLRNSAEKLQKSQLFYSFYEAFMQSFVKIVMMSKSCGNPAITQVPISPAFAKLLHAAFTQTCIKAVLKLRKSYVSTAFMQTCIKAVFLQLLRRPA